MIAKLGASNAQWAGAMVWLYVACFGLPAIPISMYLLRTGKLPWFLNLFPMYGGPWSASMSTPQLAATLWVFAAVSLLSAFGGWLLWSGQRSGAILSLAILPIEAVFWYGYALPIPVVLAVVRMGFVIAAWTALK